MYCALCNLDSFNVTLHLIFITSGVCVQSTAVCTDTAPRPLGDPAGWMKWAWIKGNSYWLLGGLAVTQPTKCPLFLPF